MDDIKIVGVPGVSFKDPKEQMDCLCSEIVDSWREMQGAELLVAMKHPERFVQASLEKAAGPLAAIGFDGDLRRRFVLQPSDEQVLASSTALKVLFAEYINPWLSEGGFDLESVSLRETKICNPKGQCTKLTRAINQSLPKQMPERALDLAQKISGAKRRPARADFVTAVSSALRGDVDLYLSVNPNDFITSTWGGGFTSCHRPGGEYFAGNMGLVTTPTCLLGYVGDPTKKTGRTWMYYMAEQQIIYQLKSYGTLPPQWRVALRRALQDAIDPVVMWVHSTKRSISTRNKDASAAYVDTGNLSTCYQEEKGYNSVTVDMGPHVCPACAVEGQPPASTDKRTGGCAKCKPAFVCCECEKVSQYSSSAGVHRHPDTNKMMCDKCFKAVFTCCCSCGCTLDTAKAVKAGDDHMCESCAREFMRECALCKKVVHENDLRQLTDDAVCDECYEEHSLPCHECAIVHDVRTMEFEGGVCATCIAEQNAQAV